MTSFKKIILIWIVIIVLVVVLFGQENNETGKIMENYLSACGGSALAEIKTETRKGTMLRGVSGKIPVETIDEPPAEAGPAADAGYPGSAQYPEILSGDGH